MEVECDALQLQEDIDEIYISDGETFRRGRTFNEGDQSDIDERDLSLNETYLSGGEIFRRVRTFNEGDQSDIDETDLSLNETYLTGGEISRRGNEGDQSDIETYLSLSGGETFRRVRTFNEGDQSDIDETYLSLKETYLSGG